MNKWPKKTETCFQMVWWMFKEFQLITYMMVVIRACKSVNLNRVWGSKFLFLWTWILIIKLSTIVKRHFDIGIKTIINNNSIMCNLSMARKCIISQTCKSDIKTSTPWTKDLEHPHRWRTSKRFKSIQSISSSTIWVKLRSCKTSTNSKINSTQTPTPVNPYIQTEAHWYHHKTTIMYLNTKSPTISQSTPSKLHNHILDRLR